MLRRTGVTLTIVLFLAASCDFGGSGDQAVPRRTPLSTPTGENSRVIALIGTVSGEEAWRGEDALEGADLAVGLLNRTLASDEQQFELITLDDQGDAERASRLVADAASLPQVVGVVYAGPPEGLPPAETALARAGIPALLVFGDLYGAQRLSAHVFQVGPPHMWGARRLASYFLRDRRYEKIGVLAEDSFSGDAAVRAMRDALSLYGVRRAPVARYASGADDFAEPLDHLEAAGSEAVVVQASPSGFHAIAAALSARGSTYKNTEAARIASLPKKVVRRLRKKDARRPWRPQVAGFDFAISPSDVDLPAGTLAAESYGRGAHYLPVPSLDAFRRRFVAWWDAEPIAWEQRAYSAVRAIGWAAAHAQEDEDLAVALEDLRERRFGSLDVTLGADDHTFVGVTTVGLWVVPRRGVSIRNRDELPDSLPWVPLSRGFSIDGETTDVLPEDWKHLFTNPPPPNGPAPKVRQLRYGVSTPKTDPVH